MKKAPDDPVFDKAEFTLRAEAADPLLVVGVDYAVEGTESTGVFVRMFQCHGRAIMAGCKCPECGLRVPR